MGCNSTIETVTFSRSKIDNAKSCSQCLRI